MPTKLKLVMIIYFLLYSTDKIKINNAFLLPEGADGSVTNGVVHAIDTVLIPPSVLLYI